MPGRSVTHVSAHGAPAPPSVVGPAAPAPAAGAVRSNLRFPGRSAQPTAAESACDRPDGPPLPDSLRPGCQRDAPAARFGEIRGRSRQRPQCHDATVPPGPANGSSTATDIAALGRRPARDRRASASSADAGARLIATIGHCDTPMTPKVSAADLIALCLPCHALATVVRLADRIGFGSVWILGLLALGAGPAPAPASTCRNAGVGTVTHGFRARLRRDRLDAPPLAAVDLKTVVEHCGLTLVAGCLPCSRNVALDADALGARFEMGGAGHGDPPAPALPPVREPQATVAARVLARPGGADGVRGPRPSPRRRRRGPDRPPGPDGTRRPCDVCVRTLSDDECWNGSSTAGCTRRGAWTAPPRASGGPTTHALRRRQGRSSLLRISGGVREVGRTRRSAYRRRRAARRARVRRARRSRSTSISLMGPV